MMAELQQQLRVETIAVGLAFEELLDLVNETCLSSREVFDRHLAAIKENRKDGRRNIVISRLGLWGVREYLEDFLDASLHAQSDAAPKKNPTSSIGYEVDPETEEAAYELLESLDSTMAKKPEPLWMPIDCDIQDKIEALGKSLLEEAFLSLGEDAPEQVIKFQVAKTVKQKIEVTNWLLNRVLAISKKGRQHHEGVIGELPDNAEAARDEHFYHPARLSPKFVGNYPEIYLQPTCLGLSIILASFFEKAGCPYFHVGVGSTTINEVRESQNSIIVQTLNFADECGIKLPDESYDRLVATLQDNWLQIDRGNGFHAAIIVRLDAGKWMQLDPYSNSNMDIPKYDGSDRLEIAYQAMTDLEKSARGTECMFMNPYGLTPYWFTGLVSEFKKSSKPISEIEDFLRNLPEDIDQIFNSIINEYFEPFLATTTKGDGRQAQAAIKAFCKSLDTDASAHIQLTLREVLMTYVFSDAYYGPYTNNWTLLDSIAKCKTDPNYLARRAEDLKLAPFLALMRFHGEHGNEIISGRIDYHPHSILEIGLPAYRIGAAVLSDFASYCGDELPASFWLTYWPSAISLIEHYPQARGSAAQKRLVNQIAESIKASTLQYSSVDSIIEFILEHEGGENPE